jgi:hypothetical protein
LHGAGDGQSALRRAASWSAVAFSVRGGKIWGGNCGVSVDGSKVYFTTNRQLVNSDLDGSAAGCNGFSGVAGCDLYLYDADKLEGERLT